MENMKRGLMNFSVACFMAGQDNDVDRLRELSGQLARFVTGQDPDPTNHNDYWIWTTNPLEWD